MGDEEKEMQQRINGIQSMSEAFCHNFVVVGYENIKIVNGEKKSFKFIKIAALDSIGKVIPPTMVCSVEDANFLYEAIKNTVDGKVKQVETSLIPKVNDASYR